ncbi:hypothetical protein BH11GEM2_BH11GEM2_25440 [soil metagenome]
MYSAIRVTGTATPSVKPLRVDTVVATDYAFRYSPTLSAGVHRFALVNAGKQRHEVAIALLEKGVTLRKIVEIDKVDGDIEPYLESALGVLHAPAGVSPAGLLSFRLLPGREYLLECGFSDMEKSAPHYKLGMYGSILVP